MQRLIRKSKNGQDRFTDIHVEDNEDGTAYIVKTSGIVNGKETVSKTLVTTGYEKAVARAKTMWKNEKIKCTAILPMLANKWEERKNYISIPFYIQPKIDGVRLLVSNKGGISRTGKIVPGTEVWGKDLKEGEYLDGECYVENKTFEEITSLFKTDPLKLEFHVFDYFDVNRPELTFDERLHTGHCTVKTIKVQKKADLRKLHKAFVEDGFEGTMIRDKESVYEPGKRSNYLLKYKDFQTEEYEIVGYKVGTGREEGTAVWECKVGEHTFYAKPEGTMAYRRKLLKNKDKYMGKMLTVRFQNLSAYGVPRFPVGIAVRDYE